MLDRGDVFCPAGFSVVGACYSSARRLINVLSHTGDILGQHVPGERFEHDSQTWATPTHRAFIVHHAAVTIARAAWLSVVKYAVSSGRHAAAADADRCLRHSSAHLPCSCLSLWEVWSWRSGLLIPYLSIKDRP